MFFDPDYFKPRIIAYVGRLCILIIFANIPIKCITRGTYIT